MKRILLISGIIIALCGGLFAQQSGLSPFQLPLDGRLITGLDPTKLISASNASQISNFSQLDNFEYTDNGIRSVRGMTKITTSPLAGNPHVNSIFQFVKANPSETHVLVQAQDSSDANGKVFRHSTSTPNTGTFTPTALHTDASGAGTGRFNDAPIGHVVYCNGKETDVWGGIENSPGYFSIFDGADPLDATAWIKDYTESVLNSLTDSENVATLKQTTSAHYNIGIGSVTAYVATRLPIQGAKFTMASVNTNASTALVHYWNGSTLTAVTGLVDGTSSGGIPLAQTGTVSFDSTETTAKVRIIEGVYGYFYRFIWPNATETATISQVTVDEPFQKLQDFWDGSPRTILSLQVGTGTVFTDGTTNVFEDKFSYDDSTLFDEATYISVDNKGGAGSVIDMGFNERVSGVEVKFIPDKVNTVANVLTVSYWNGVSFVSVSGLNDGTSTEATSFKQSGLISWTPIAENVEFRRTVGGRKEPLYYYQFSFNNTMQGTTDKLFVYHINGLPVQKRISNYKFGLNAQGRLWLFGDQSNGRNKSIVSNVSTLNVFNGIDSGDPIFYGNDEGIEAAAEIHSRTTGGSRSNILVLKNNSTYLLRGNSPEDWEVITVSDGIGCNAPLTLTTTSIGLEFSPLQSKQIAIWQGTGGVYLWDSTSIIPLSDAISNYFDQAKPEAINLDRADISRGFFETHNDGHYYHWLFSSKATTTAHLDTELVFDLKRQGWFKMDRGTLPIQTGTRIVATDTGSAYSYGTVDNGEMYRLDNGKSFDGSNITSTFATGDIPLTGSVMTSSQLRYIRLGMVAKATTTNNVTLTHYIDGKATGDDFAMSPTRSGFRLSMPIKGADQIGTFHRFIASMTANDEDRGFEPLFIGGLFKPWRELHE